MGIKNRISNAHSAMGREDFYESFLKNEREHKADRLVEKWARVKEVGKGIENMPVSTARNLAILLENQAGYMSKMSEAQLSGSFANFSPENMLRLVRLSYPNSIRGMLFTEFAMQTANDSIKYIEPVYTNAQRNDFDWDNAGTKWDMDNRFDDAANNRDDIMYESTESRYATELINCDVTGDSELSVSFTEGAFKDAGYLDGSSAIYMIVDGKRYCLAMQNGTEYDGAEWFFSNVKYSEQGVAKSLRVAKIEGTKPSFKVTLEGDLPSEASYVAIGRYDSERDLTGKYLGEVELQIRTYHFRPRPISLGVTWTQLAEITLDTSYGVSAEEMLMDFAAQEIKKTLDFQAVKMASAAQRTYANQTVVIDAQPGDKGGIKDSYWHTAQLVGQAINRVGDLQLNEFNRGGVSAIVGGPAAVEYLKLSTVWKDTGRQASIGGHKCGEFDGIPVFKVPSRIIADDELVTTWKNSSNENDVAMAIGTLIPFFSTGAIQRKNFYKEAGIARYEDTRILQPKYFGRIQIQGLRTI